MNRWWPVFGFGLVLALAAALYLGMGFGAHDAEERLMWDGIPPSRIIEHFHYIPDLALLFPLVLLILGLALAFLGRWLWWVAGLAVLALFAVTPYWTVHGLIKREMGGEMFLSHGNWALIDDQRIIVIFVLAMSLILSLVMRGIRNVILSRHMVRASEDAQAR